VDVTMAKPGRLLNGFAFLLGTAAAVAAIYVAVNQVPN